MTASLAKDEAKDVVLEERERPHCVDENEMSLDVERMLDRERVRVLCADGMTGFHDLGTELLLLSAQHGSSGHKNV